MIKKNKILLIGYSAIAQKAIIPAIKNHKKVTLVGIASQTKASKINSDLPIFDNYERAIEKSGCDTVYISTQNSSHYKLIDYCLKRKLNIIVDKPAVLSKKEAKKCYQLANNQLLIFESIPYLYHSQHQKLKIILESQTSSLNKISVQFGFPPLEKNNYRNDKKLGGGCLFDLGPYLVSVGQYYFNSRPKKVYCSVSINKQSGIPMLAAVTIDFGESKTLQGDIGFDLEYRNNLDLWGSGFYLSLDRAFTAPKDYTNNILYRSRNIAKDIPVESSDSFLEMFNHYAKIKPESYLQYNKAFLDQAIILDAIIKSSKSGRVETINYE
ncbi:MAG: Gfo/Idh/MocA family oxidoreductase [Candidatus Taylorbacteria bacterium]|nr:Gfo/Idh/MocA family oxidoreductase [Candidatus Taylorbacteria bacterium]